MHVPQAFSAGTHLAIGPVVSSTTAPLVIYCISEYSTDIHHVSGKDNTMTNSLSHPFTIATAAWTQNGLNLHKLAEDQASDPSLIAAIEPLTRTSAV